MGLLLIKITVSSSCVIIQWKHSVMHGKVTHQLSKNFHLILHAFICNKCSAGEAFNNDKNCEFSKGIGKTQRI